MQLKPTRFAVLLAGFIASYGAAAQEVATAEVGAIDALAISQATTGTSDIGRIEVQGAAGPADTGLITPDSTPKARSSVDRKFIDKQNPTSNPYQSLELLPGVNTGSQDSSGLFGGNLRVRGFNSDQLGFTVDGVPVNDSGNFAVFPQEYTDSENLCNVFITQGSVDTEAPHVGASGGNVGLSTCDPQDKAGLTANYTGGSEKLSRSYGKLETGLIGGRWKSYLSYSKSQIDKFKGDGRADRDHLDFVTTFDLGAGSHIKGSFLYNDATNNNIRQLSKAQIATRGYLTDFSGTPPNHLAPVNGTTQTETVPADGYFAFNLNPFENYIASVTAHFQFLPSLAFDFSPYLYHGFGTGGGQLATLSEAVGSNQLHGGLGDLNGDGDTRDTVLVYRSSITTTYRPGATFGFTLSYFDHNTIKFGYWAERAHHIQTQPAQLITSKDPTTPLVADNVSSVFLDDPDAWLRTRDGSVYQGRDTRTVSTGKSLFISDTITLLNDKLTLSPGFRHSGEDRDVTNFANFGTTGAAGTAANQNFASNGFGFYRIKNAAVKNLPSLGINYQLTDTQSVYANGSRNFRVPSNFTYFNLSAGGTIVNGVYQNYRVVNNDVEAETTNNFDLGYRFAGEKVTFSSALFYSLFQNRIASAFDEQTQRRTDQNVGSSKQYGAEVEGAWAFYPHFTAYASGSYTRSIISDDILNGRAADGTPVFIATSKNQFPDTPNWLFASSLQYSIGKFYLFTQGKYTGRRQSSLVNDESAAGYALLDVGVGYTFPEFGPLKALKLQAVGNNLTNQKYLLLNSGSGSNFVNNTQGTGASVVNYYVGAPVSFALTLSTQFGL